MVVVLDQVKGVLNNAAQAVVKEGKNIVQMVKDVGKGEGKEVKQDVEDSKDPPEESAPVFEKVTKREEDTMTSPLT